MTICTGAMYLLFNKHRITRSLFRVLVFAIIVSLVYDIAWFIIKHHEFSTDTKADGGMETNIRKIVLMLSYMGFLLKVLIFFDNFLDNSGYRFLEGFYGFLKDYSK